MNTFKRTHTGLSNLHLFYNTDCVVYLEGGTKCFNKEEVYKGNFSEDTEDIIFWKNIFKKSNQNNSLKFKSVGSKTTLKSLSEDIISGSIKNVYIAMDNEFDEILKNRISHDNIFYTYGYSFENDIWNESVIVDILEELTASEIDENYIRKGFKKFLKDIKIAVVSDGYLFKKDLSFFPREKGHLFCIECDLNFFPRVKSQEISILMSKNGLNEKIIRSFGYRNKIEPLRFCFGHLLANYCCLIINHYLKIKHNLPSIRKKIIYRMGIKIFFDNHFDNSEIKPYYEKQFSINL